MWASAVVGVLHTQPGAWGMNPCQAGLNSSVFHLGLLPILGSANSYGLW